MDIASTPVVTVLIDGRLRCQPALADTGAMSRFWSRYSAAIVLTSIALTFNVIHFITEVVIGVDPGTFGYWINTTAENLQSEAWQVALAAWVFKHFRWIGTPETDKR